MMTMMTVTNEEENKRKKKLKDDDDEDDDDDDYCKQEKRKRKKEKKQGRIHGNPVADGWAGAVMRKPLAIQKCYGPTDRQTDGPTDTARCRVACPRLKRGERQRKFAAVMQTQLFMSTKIHGKLENE